MYRIGVDLGGTNIVVGVVNDKYEIVAKDSTKTNIPRDAKEIFDDICTCTENAIAKAGISIADVESIGIGTPGSCDKEKGVIIYANNLYFDNVPAVDYVHERFPDTKVYIENDANCAALGEALAGCGKGKSSFVAVTLGTGVGGGVVLDGKILTGYNDAGGELGHMCIKFDGLECTCGRIGCWETYASATALVNQTKEAMLAHKESKMWELCGGDIENASGRTAFDAMRAGDEWGTKVVNSYIRHIAIGTVNIINIFQPELICFGGGICNEGETLLAPLRELIHGCRYSKKQEKQTDVCRATLGNDAGVIGAALVEY